MKKVKIPKIPKTPGLSSRTSCGHVTVGKGGKAFWTSGSMKGATKGRKK